jgi:DNA processing protein
MIEGKKFVIAVHKTLSLSPLRFLKIKSFFNNDWQAVWQAKISDFQEAEIDKKGIEKFFMNREKINPDEEIEKLKKCNAKVLVRGDSDYPLNLENISNPPSVLFFRGEMKETDFPAIAVVGSRKVSSYGKRAIEKIVAEISFSGVTIISGLALGTDVLAQKCALKNGSRTIGVLGNGIDDIYPLQNKNFAEKFLAEERGIIISEYFPGAETRPENFPIRNRIVSGLAKAIVIIEAAEKSGSLITAQIAIEQNREVFAVPGEIFSTNSAGTNQLIFNGSAHPALNGKDILEICGFRDFEKKQIAKKEIPKTDIEHKILKLFESESKIHLDEIIRMSELQGHIVSSNVSILEIKGFLKHCGQQIYAKNF